MRELTGVMDTMVVASRQLQPPGKVSGHQRGAVDGKKAGYELIGVEGDDTSEWILVDFGDVIVHVSCCQPPERFTISSVSGLNAPGRFARRRVQGTNDHLFSAPSE